MIVIKQSIVDQMKNHASNEVPIEACGYLAGIDNEITTIYPMTNMDHCAKHFSLDPQEQLKVMKDARTHGLKLLAVYHSHPVTPARMSTEDKKLAFDPDIVYIIYSLCDEEIRGFRMVENNEFEEVDLEVGS